MSIENYGKYQLLKRLAMGGMAQIYLARRRGSEGADAPLLVVKRILPHLAENTEFVRMFLDEARIAARLDHPNIVQIFDLGAQDDSFFIAMEYIHGEDLRRVWKRAERSGQLIPVPVVCRIMSLACAGLDHAHKKMDASGRPLNIVHRDISPQNILLTFDGRVKVVDFGIAKAADQATVTRSGVLKGKYSYMSPEQAAGQRVDRRSDIFALGVVLYELLTGTRLFKRSSDMVTLQAVSECVIQLPSLVNPRVPASLDAVVMKALARDPGDRYAQTEDLQRALEEWLDAQEEPSSPAHVATFMKELYAARLAEEARMGDVLVEEAEAPSPAGKTPERGAQTMAAPRQDTDAPHTPRVPRPSLSRLPAADRKAQDARRTVDLRRASDTGEQPSLAAPMQTGRDQPSLSAATDTENENEPGGATLSLSTDATQSLNSRDLDEATVARPSRVRPGLRPAPPVAPVPEPQPSRRLLWGVGAAVLLGLLLGAAWAWHSETQVPPSPAPLALEPPKARPATPEPPPQRTPPSGTGQVRVTVKTTPGQVRLKVDGKAYDKLPATLMAQPGQKLVLVAEAPHFQSLTLEKVVGQEPEQEVPLELLPEASPPQDDHRPERVRTPRPPPSRPPPAETRLGQVRFIVDTWAEVTCGGRKLGSTPMGDVSLAAGFYECKFSNPEQGTSSQRIEVRPNDLTRVKVKF